MNGICSGARLLSMKINLNEFHFMALPKKKEEHNQRVNDLVPIECFSDSFPQNMSTLFAQSHFQKTEFRTNQYELAHRQTALQFGKFQ